MRVLVSAIPLSGLVTGIGRYLRSLYRAMEENQWGDDIHVDYFDGRSIHHSMPPAAEPTRWARHTAALWRLPDPAVFALRCLHWFAYEKNLRRFLRSQPYHIYHEASFSPAALPNLPQVFSLCDLSLLRYPETHPRERVWFFKFLWRQRKRFATHILTLSQYMREEICDMLDWPENRVTAVPLAPADVFHPRDKRDVAATCRALGVPDDYLLFVGSLEPRKNLDLLVKALEQGRFDIPLVLVGWEGWGEKAWLKAVRSNKLKKRIFVVGYVDDETLARLYTGAMALVYPSLYEGFGLPILEAMACGCPVICSNVSSMPEVAEDAARLINPLDVQDLIAAIDEVVDSSVYRAHLSKKGLVRASTFNWARTARETLEVFRAVMDEKRAP